jgi:hypothetical protein
MGGIAMIARGVIKHVDRKQQINDFSGLLFGKITPTDIDGVIEYQDKAYVFIEVKYGDADLPYGQKLALQRLVIDTIKSGKKAIIVVVQHEVKDTSESVNVSECKVRCYFHNNEWVYPRKVYSARKLIELFLKAVDNVQIH